MSSTHKYATPNTVETLFSTDLDSAAGQTVFVSSSIDNTSGLYKFGDFEIYTSQGADQGMFHSLFMLEALDGTNYEEATSSPDTGEALLVGAQLLGNLQFWNTSGFQRHVLRGIPLPATKFKVAIWVGIQAVRTLAASGNTVRMLRYYEVDV